MPGPELLIGSLLMLSGFSLALWAWSTLRWAGGTGWLGPPRLVDEGPYAWCRHPQYLGMVVATLGLGMVLARALAHAAGPNLSPWAAGVVWLMPMGLLLVSRLHWVPAEEQRLAQAHGGWWADYRAQVPRGL
jgi:protein-S-isoprenylcysteine O-methyltransferase Ste14